MRPRSLKEKTSKPLGTCETRRVLLSVIVVSWNGKELLRRCLGSIRQRLKGARYETIVVDNGSTDGAPEMVEREFPEVRLIRNATNLGFGRGNNIGMAVAGGDFYLLLNSDTRLVDETPLRLIERLRERPEVGIIGPRLRFEDGRLQASAHRFVSFSRLLVEELGLYKLLPRARVVDLLLAGYWDHSEEREVDWITGACMVVRQEVFQQTGGFNADMFLYGEEVEWCHRIRARGWSVLFSPVGEIMHVGHASADLLLGEEGRIDRCLIASDKLIRSWHGRLAGALAPAVRIAGAVLRLTVFSLGLARKGNEVYARDVRHASKVVLKHYFRRVLGRANQRV